MKKHRGRPASRPQAEGRRSGAHQPPSDFPPPPPDFMHLVAPPMPWANVPMASGAWIRAAAAAAERADDRRRRRRNVWPSARGFQEALNLLEENDAGNADDRRPIDDLWVIRVVDEPNDEENDVDDAPSFSRFVTLLGQPEGGREVRGISFMSDWGGLHDADMKHLFAEVLPNHRTLTEIRILVEDLPARFVRMLTSRISSPVDLSIMALDPDPTEVPNVVEAIVDLLRRDAAGTALTLDLNLDPELGRRICQVVPCCTGLRELLLTFQDVNANTLDGVAATTSLRRLDIHGSFAEGAVPSFAKNMRTNETLEVVWLNDVDGNNIRDTQALVELVKTYNYVLEMAGVNWGMGHNTTLHARVHEQLQHYLRRNQRIRDALTLLKETHEEPKAWHLRAAKRVVVGQRSHAGQFAPSPDAPTLARAAWQLLPYSCRRQSMPTHLLPNLLGLVSDLPTVLNRVLKMGYVNEVAHLLAKAHGNSIGRRRRSQPVEEGLCMEDKDCRGKRRRRESNESCRRRVRHRRR